jgi:hypothetical protein
MLSIMSLIVGPPSSPQLPARVEQSTAAQVEARALVQVPPTAVTVSGKQDRSGGASRQNAGSHQGAPPRDHGANAHLRGRLVDIVV